MACRCHYKMYGTRRLVIPYAEVTMIGCTVLLLVIFELASSQILPPNMPPECLEPPKGVTNPQECCKIPEFFSDEDFSTCGFMKQEPAATRGPPECSKTACVMKKNNLMDGEKVNIESLRAYMEKWAENNSLFKPAMQMVKERCLIDPVPGPYQVCDTNKVLFCTTTMLFSDCPVWENTTECRAVRDHMKRCMPKANIV